MRPDGVAMKSILALDYKLRDEMDETRFELSDADLLRLRKASALASEQLKQAKQIVTDGGFAGPGAGPLLIAAVLQAMATNCLIDAERR